MGMLIDGIWHNDEDRSMVDGTYRRESSVLKNGLTASAVDSIRNEPDRYVLVASASCP